MRSRGESETDILFRRMGKSRSRILKTSVDYVVGYLSSCARTFTRAYSRCCKRTPARACHVRSLESSGINDDACVAKWQHRPVLPNDYRRLSFTSARSTVQPPIFLPFAFLSLRVFHLLHLPFLPHLLPWVFWPLGTICNLETSHGVPHRRRYVVVVVVDRTRKGFSSPSTKTPINPHKRI